MAHENHGYVCKKRFEPIGGMWPKNTDNHVEKYVLFMISFHFLHPTIIWHLLWCLILSNQICFDGALDRFWAEPTLCMEFGKH